MSFKILKTATELTREMLRELAIKSPSIESLSEKALILMQEADSSIIISSGPFVSVAISVACKLVKEANPPTKKLMKFSKLKTYQWKNLENRCLKLFNIETQDDAENCHSVNHEVESRTFSTTEDIGDLGCDVWEYNRRSFLHKILEQEDEDEEENYYSWSKRILSECCY